MTAVTDSGGEWVRRFHPSGEDGVRLVCFPHAGGSASYFFPTSQALAPGIETLAMQYPGRQDRRSEPCVESIPELADRAFEALRPWEDRPLVFFGHSMGSILAFEVAWRFQQKTGAPPAWLFASGYPAPSRLRGGTVHLRDDAGIVEELRRSGGTDDVWLADEDLMATILPPTRADYKAIETHPRTFDAVLDCPLTMLTGDSDHQTTIAEAESWREHTSGAFDLRVFSGGHFYLDQHGPELLDLISATVKDILR
jgi:surfactin synthase thioesterase subunit